MAYCQVCVVLRGVACLHDGAVTLARQVLQLAGEQRAERVEHRRVLLDGRVTQHPKPAHRVDRRGRGVWHATYAVHHAPHAWPYTMRRTRWRGAPSSMLSSRNATDSSMWHAFFAPRT
jgi:hypothetical protein